MGAISHLIPCTFYGIRAHWVFHFPAPSMGSLDVSSRLPWHPCLCPQVTRAKAARRLERLSPWSRRESWGSPASLCGLCLQDRVLRGPGLHSPGLPGQVLSGQDLHHQSLCGLGLCGTHVATPLTSLRPPDSEEEVTAQLLTKPSGGGSGDHAGEVWGWI